MIYSQAGQLPHHQYCFVEASFLGLSGAAFIPCVWFGLVSIPGRMWGCTIMLECGAVYRAVPPHALAFDPQPELDWRPDHAQRWDCYGTDFTTIEYTFLRGLECQIKCADQIITGDYLFTAAPIGDSWSRTDGERLTIQPTDKVIFIEKSFTEHQWPTGLRTTDKIYTCE
jgi:hypothetical protein